MRSWGFPCLVVFLFGGNPRIKTPLSCLDAHDLEVSSRSCVAVSPFLTGNPSIRGSKAFALAIASPSGEGKPQVEHLFKTEINIVSAQLHSLISSDQFVSSRGG